MSVSILQNLWKTAPPSSLTPQQKYWLTRPGALTQGLRQLGKVNIVILKETATTLTEEERLAIHCPHPEAIWVREILMNINDRPCVWARSITPLTAAQSVWRGIRQLNTRPLAEILYDDTRISRSSFEISRIHPASVLYPALKRYFPEQIRQAHYARRSVFYKDKAPLMVTECFLPEFWML
ncbi:MAG: chorismate lyase [Pelistega sp.]|nr:chorismate lyase [Pelistega sp.]